VWSGLRSYSCFDGEGAIFCRLRTGPLAVGYLTWRNLGEALGRNGDDSR
jgi:hypothetical protein